MPCPPPTHIVMSPVVLSCQSRLLSIVFCRRAPVMPNGWPTAMAHSRSRITHTIARMEAAGYVVRGTTPEDGRGVVATMTETGYELLVKAAPCHVESVRRNLVDLVPAADFAAVGRVFDRVADHLVNRHPESEIR